MHASCSEFGTVFIRGGVERSRSSTLWPSAKRRKIVTNSKILAETEHAKETDGKKQKKSNVSGRKTDTGTSSDTDNETIKKTLSERLGERGVDAYLEC